MKTPPTLERRILRRIPVDRDVVVGTNDQDLKPGRLLNLSQGGALLNCPIKLSVNQMIEVRLTTDKPPFCRAAVVRVAKAGASYGIRWLEFNEDHLPRGFLFQERL